MSFKTRVMSIVHLGHSTTVREGKFSNSIRVPTNMHHICFLLIIECISASTRPTATTSGGVVEASAREFIRQISLSDEEIVVDCNKIHLAPNSKADPHTALSLSLDCRENVVVTLHPSSRVQLRLLYMLYFMNGQSEMSGLKFDGTWYANRSSRKYGLGISNLTTQPPVVPTASSSGAWSPIQPRVFRSFIQAVSQLPESDRAWAMQLASTWPSTGLSGNVPSFYGAPINAALVYSIMWAEDLKDFLNRQLGVGVHMSEFNRLANSGNPAVGIESSHEVLRIVYEQVEPAAPNINPFPYRMAEMSRGQRSVLNSALRSVPSVVVPAGFLFCDRSSSPFGSAILSETVGYGWTAICLCDLQRSDFAFEVDRVMYRHTGSRTLVDYLRRSPFQDPKTQWISALKPPMDLFSRLIRAVNSPGVGSVPVNDRDLTALQSITALEVYIPRREPAGGVPEASGGVVPPAERVDAPVQLGFAQCSGALASMVPSGSLGSGNPIATPNLEVTRTSTTTAVPLRLIQLAMLGKPLEGSETLSALTSAYAASRQILGVAVDHTQLSTHNLKPAGNMLLILIAELQLRLGYTFSNSMYAYASSSVLSFVQCLGGSCAVVCYPFDWILEVQSLITPLITRLDRGERLFDEVDLSPTPSRALTGIRGQGDSALPSGLEYEETSHARFFAREILYLARSVSEWRALIPAPLMSNAQLVFPYVGRPTSAYTQSKGKLFMVGNPLFDTCMLSFGFYSAGRTCNPLAHKIYCQSEDLDTALVWSLVGSKEMEKIVTAPFSLDDVSAIRSKLAAGTDNCGFRSLTPTPDPNVIKFMDAGIIAAAVLGGIGLVSGIVVAILCWLHKLGVQTHVRLPTGEKHTV